MTGAQPSGSLMTCGQLTLSQLIRLLFPACLLFFFPLALYNSSLCLQYRRRESGALFSLFLSFTLSLSLIFCFFISVCASQSLHHLPLFLSHAPSTGEFSFLLLLCMSKRLKELGHFFLLSTCSRLSKSGEEQSLASPGE